MTATTAQQDPHDPNIYTITPDNFALWIPASIARRADIKKGTKMTQAQFDSAEIQKLIEGRLARKK